MVTELVVLSSGGRGPLRCQPANASFHEAQRFLAGAHLLQQDPDVRLENSLNNNGKRKKKTKSQVKTADNFRCGRRCGIYVHLVRKLMRILENRLLFRFTKRKVRHLIV